MNPNTTDTVLSTQTSGEGLDASGQEATEAIYDKAREEWNPSRVDLFRKYGLEIVLGHRHGYEFEDLASGRTIINMHINGGVFNLGHCNPEVRQALVKGSERYDAGNHYFPSQVKMDFVDALLKVSPDYMRYVNVNTGGGESIDSAIKFARHATGRRRVITVHGCFHGATGFAMQAGPQDQAAFFNSIPNPDEFSQIDYDDLDQLEGALRQNDTACVLLESLPATAGFPIPHEGYFKAVTELTHRYGALYVADEVQTGLMRSGTMWCSVGYGAEPDMIVTGKGLSGGYYPISAVIMNDRAGQWLKDDGFAQTTSFSTSELGCYVGTKVLDITSRDSTRRNVSRLSELFSNRLAEIQSRHRFLAGVRQRGVIMGLVTAHPEGSTALMAALYRNGVWAMRANFDQRVLQFKAGLLMNDDMANTVLDALDVSLGQAAAMLGVED
ncbi:MAG: aminotransferase class III-fold pyridoxal phosphate-dependent enzyme [Bifidobacterium aquikefiri]|uniref:Acetylornithine aminotransferase n=3 Tax=Bifidobacterium aquikefiri TaxID=1653207 RepID=A0A261G1K4_9BIFI|nr:aminotransferase class III-fold pyridoxal phosphate-dependent enzyme [Bifidobacterium aquikefiri]OZG65115.1 Acetylornithine aminotransferase [Bifidobacterium aquikefiri]